jgi:hypothetical protein
MPEFTGATDEKHTFTLPSEIDSVHWDRRQAAPGGIVGLTVQTLFCGDGSQIQIKLQDAQGTVHNTLSGKLRDDQVNVDLQVPPQAKGGLLAKVKMPNHGLSAESEALKVIEPVRMRGARWSQKTVKRGDIVTLSAEARRAQDGRRATVRIFERDPGRGAHDPVTHLRPRTEGGAVEVMYQFQYPGDTTDIVPEWEAPNGYTQPEFFYTVEVAGVTADSKKSKSKGTMTFVDDLTVQVVDVKSGAPYANQKAKIKLADGSTKSKTTDGSGIVELKEIPPGPAKVKLPELGTPKDEPKESPQDATHVASYPSENGPVQTAVATGSPWQVWVRRSSGPPESA